MQLPKTSQSPLAVAPTIKRPETSAAPAETVTTTLVENAGERKLTLARASSGQTHVALSPGPIKHLVLSGGGAKGIAFPGVVQALEEKNVLAGIKVISGSSAGAISAAVLASGMDAKAFETLSNNLELPELLNSKNPLVAWLQNASSKLGKLAGRLPGPAGNISQLLFTMLPRLQTEAQPLEELVRNESRKSILAHIANTPRQTRPAEVMKIADKLSAGGAPTFGDLAVLSRHIPAIKQLNITGTGMFDGRPQLVVFNASLTPDMDIARAAHISGSLPVLFKSPSEKGHGFQASAEETAFKDGGLLLNTPASGVVDPVFPESPLSKSESLVIDFESEAPAKPKDRGGIGDSLADGITGTPHSAAEAYQNARLKAMADQRVTLPLNTDKGDFRGLLNGTVNFTMTAEQKKNLQVLARKAVETHMENRAAVREQHSFGSLDEAVLAMDDEMFASAQAGLEKDKAAGDVLLFRKSALQVLQTLDNAITEANQAKHTLTITPKIASALRNLDALARRPEHVEWLGRRLNAAGSPNFQQLLQVMTKPSGDKTAMSKVMTSAVAEMKRRDIAVIAGNFTREVIYPSLFRPGQPDSNVALLRQAEYELTKVATPAEFNRVLDTIINNYRARNKPWKKAFSSSTIEMAKAWRLPVK
ncbi:patatin-like phospholipase family protein [uncultured Pseudomonas sp.]|uniref:patatin-like phospholipase family protein n=1 Tax=uncultured Pseudomonas sp. TaxID=114707 RepID=UPI0025FFDBC5|nr:patatin-like phospholipase family protein [uncultured Pseudomonas sp.]